MRSSGENRQQPLFSRLTSSGWLVVLMDVRIVALTRYCSSSGHLSRCGLLSVLPLTSPAPSDRSAGGHGLKRAERSRESLTETHLVSSPVGPCALSSSLDSSSSSRTSAPGSSDCRVRDDTRPSRIRTAALVTPVLSPPISPCGPRRGASLCAYTHPPTLVCL